jgi:hypothetical protein
MHPGQIQMRGGIVCHVPRLQGDQPTAETVEIFAKNELLRTRDVFHQTPQTPAQTTRPVGVTSQSRVLEIESIALLPLNRPEQMIHSGILGHSSCPQQSSNQATAD